MKLTLTAGGGITGLIKEHSVDINNLNESTRAALMDYVRETGEQPPRNYSETWSLPDGKKVPVIPEKLPSPLKELYNTMKENLSYKRFK
jgi:hypothetical protein